MDTQTLKTFLLLAKLKNFTQTAEQLFVAQSTVTNRIADLEAELGKPLFTRSKRSVALTAEGHTFRRYAQRIIDIENAALQDIHSIKQYESSLHVGTTNTIYECHLQGHMEKWISAAPQSALKITIGHSNELLRLLQDGVLDVAYCYIPLYKKGWHCEIFAVDELVLVTIPADNLWKNGMKKEDLPQTRYLFCNFALQEVGSFIRELFPPHYQFPFEIDNSTKLIPYLLHSGGVSFLPESLAAPYLEAGSLVRIPLLDFETPKICCYKIEKKK